MVALTTKKRGNKPVNHLNIDLNVHYHQTVIKGTNYSRLEGTHKNLIPNYSRTEGTNDVIPNYSRVEGTHDMITKLLKTGDSTVTFTVTTT